VNIDSTGSEFFHWTAGVAPTDASWLSIQPATGSVDQDVTLVITPTGMTPGTYQATVRITADTQDISNGEQEVLVTLHVLEGLYETFLPAALIGGR
jgi:hypothetical protein